MCVVQIDLFTTKITLRLRSGQAPDTKVSDTNTLNFVLRRPRAYAIRPYARISSWNLFCALCALCG